MSKTNITPFDASEYLDSEETIVAYLADAFESGSEDVMLAALKDVAKARGMTKVAAEAGVQRESLYKALGEGAKPRFETILKVTKALGVKIALVPGDVEVFSTQVQAINKAKTIAKGSPARKSGQHPGGIKPAVAAKRAGVRRTGTKTGRNPKAAHA